MKYDFICMPAEISSEGCDQIIADCQQFPLQEATVGSASGKMVDTSMRNSKIRWVGEFEKIRSFVTSHVFKANKVFGFDIRTIDEVQYTEYYGTDGGHFAWHQDVDWFTENEMHRKLSFVLQLSDPSEYVGGEFQFINGHNDILQDFKQKGSILIFPSFMVHRVSPVTQGLRRSLVSWCEGLKWR